MKLVFNLIVLVFALHSFAQRNSTRAQAKTIPPKLRFDGLYNTLDNRILECGQRANERYTTNFSVVFYSNGEAHLSGGASLDYAPLYREYQERIPASVRGRFTLRNDTVYADLPTLLKTGLKGDRYHIVHF